MLIKSSLCVVRTSCTKSFTRSNTTISHSILRLVPIGRSFSGHRFFSGTAATFGRKKASPPPAQSVSPLAPIGINAALQAATDSSITPKPKIFEEFALSDRVGIVSGANRGLGLEMALALCEAGARAIYCFDLPPKPSDEWTKTQEYVKRMQNGSRLEYVSVDVRDQQVVWHKAHEIGDREKRMDVCVAAAGILKSHTDCLTYPAEQFKEVCVVGPVFFRKNSIDDGTGSKVMDVNTNGVLYTAQAAGQQMLRFGNRGSIILIASMSGSITNKVGVSLNQYYCRH